MAASVVLMAPYRKHPHPWVTNDIVALAVDLRVRNLDGRITRHQPALGSSAVKNLLDQIALGRPKTWDLE
jgi:hypothetical protein